jgi:hypothetical protein
MLAIGPGLLSRRSGSRLHETGPAPLLEPNVDDIEVPRNHRLGKDLARLPGNLGAEVAVGEVGQREQADLGGLGQRRRAGRRGVERLVRARALLLGEGRLVDEHVGRLGDLQDAR